MVLSVWLSRAVKMFSSASVRVSAAAVRRFAESWSSGPSGSDRSGAVCEILYVDSEDSDDAEQVVWVR